MLSLQGTDTGAFLIILMLESSFDSFHHIAEGYIVAEASSLPAAAMINMITLLFLRLLVGRSTSLPTCFLGSRAPWFEFST